MVIAADCGGSGVPASTNKAGVGVRVGVGEAVGVRVTVGEGVGVADGLAVAVEVGTSRGAEVADGRGDSAVQAVRLIVKIKPQAENTLTNLCNPSEFAFKDVVTYTT